MNISDINAEIRSLCDADSTSLSDAVLLRRVNNAYENIIGQIISFDRGWQFDDSNYTDLPIGTADLVAGQQDYSFPASYLNVERVEVKDNSGIWHKLTPVDRRDITVALAEYQKTNGLPTEYDPSGGSVFLYPSPSAASTTLASGLKVYFQRTADIFTSVQVTTGTKVPGFASPFHMLLCYKAAFPYCQSYKKDRVPGLIRQIESDEIKLKQHYLQRGKQATMRIRVGTRDSNK